MRLGLDHPPPEPSEAAEASASFVLGLRAHGVRDLAVLRAMEAVPRAAFVAGHLADLALRDVALPIPCGQTMPEPVCLARMLDSLDCSPWSRVLEIGTGSGYSTALLARLAGEVVSIERFARLVIEARARLGLLGVLNANVIWADGLDSVPVEGNFDRIVVHAALEVQPATLIDRLAPEGMLIYPVLTDAKRGRRSQCLMACTRDHLHVTSRALASTSRLQPVGAGRSRVL